MKHLNRRIYAIVCVVVMLFAGLCYAWSVMAKSISATYPEWTEAQLSLTFTLVIGCISVSAIVVGILNKRVSPRVFIIVSAAFLLAGFLMAASVGSSPFLLYLGFGVIGGLGSGFAYATVMGLMSAWFPDKQGLISGILLMAFAFGAFIVGKVFAAVAPPGDEMWRMMFRLFGIIICVLFVICSFFFVKPDADFAPPVSKRKKQVREPASEIPIGQMAKKPVFWMYYIWAVLLASAGLILLSQGSGIALQVGSQITPGTVATVVGLISVLNGAGRVVFGAIFDKKGFRMTLTLSMIIFFIACLCLVLALKSGTFAFVVLGFSIGGFAYGAVTPTNSAFVSDFYGRENYAMNFSLINTTMLVASFASTIAGRLYDVSGSYLNCIFLMIGVIIAGAVVSAGIRRPK